MVNDVARAYFNAPSLKPTLVEICDEDFGPGGENMCGELRSVDVCHKASSTEIGSVATQSCLRATALQSPELPHAFPTC